MKKRQKDEREWKREKKGEKKKGRREREDITLKKSSKLEFSQQKEIPVSNVASLNNNVTFLKKLVTLGYVI